MLGGLLVGPLRGPRARELGLRNVADLEGGFAAWKEAGLPGSATLPPTPSGLNHGGQQAQPESGTVPRQDNRQWGGVAWP